MSGKLIHNLKRQRAALRIVVAGGQAMASAGAAAAPEEQPLNLVLTGSSASSARISGPAPSPSRPHLAAAVLDYLPAKRRRRRTPTAAPPTPAPAPAPAPARAAPPPSPPPPPQLAPAVAQRDFLQIALQKVLELQRDLSAIDAQGEVRAAAAGGANAGPPDNGDAPDAPDSGNEEEDERFLKDEAEALGFAMCAREALQFLADAGEPRDGELVRRLRASLVGGCAGLPI